ncbi:MAG: hypothetical protein ACR2OW_15560 [Methyloligellaceae bacterium]
MNSSQRQFLILVSVFLLTIISVLFLAKNQSLGCAQVYPKVDSRIYGERFRPLAEIRAIAAWQKKSALVAEGSQYWHNAVKRKVECFSDSAGYTNCRASAKPCQRKQQELVLTTPRKF